MPWQTTYLYPSWESIVVVTSRRIQNSHLTRCTAVFRNCHSSSFISALFAGCWSDGYGPGECDAFADGYGPGECDAFADGYGPGECDAFAGG